MLRAHQVPVALPPGQQLEKTAPAPLHLPWQVAPKTLLQLADELSELLGEGDNLRHGCRSRFKKGL
jgi:hypothetical protein